VSARDEILARVRAAAPGRAAHPGPHRPPQAAADFARFRDRVAGVGGVAHGPFGGSELSDRVRALARERGPGRVVATGPALARLGEGPWRATSPGAAPASFADVHVAIASGRIGVAESGAIAVLEEDAPQRALLFLCQHLILLLPAQGLAADLHAAFAALPDPTRAAPRLSWISGPSKTADIEQALVYGAHGPLTLDVVLCAD
jgi:L-lactate dehydrogenase complex protein LldG